jgi:hypothetical protein
MQPAVHQREKISSSAAKKPQADFRGGETHQEVLEAPSQPGEEAVPSQGPLPPCPQPLTSTSQSFCLCVV